MAIQRYPKLEITHFLLTFLNINISLIFKYLCLQFSLRIVGTYLEGRMSKIVNICLSFFCDM